MTFFLCCQSILPRCDPLCVGLDDTALQRRLQRATATIQSVAALIVLVATSAVIAQQQVEPRKPGPEQTRLEFFVGDWHSDAQKKPGPWGAGGPVISDDQCSLMDGSFFVICNSALAGAMGKMTGLGVMGYDGATKTYTRTWFHSDGATAEDLGVLNGNSWCSRTKR